MRSAAIFVLKKTGPLSTDEFRQIQSHVRIGVHILSDLKKLHHILPGVAHHHESIDGTGYPSGLVGDAIPFEARILAVADSFDAMSSTRPYRRRLTPAQIDAHIASIRKVFSRFLNFDAGALMANNADWLDELHYIPFLREVGRHFTINKMLTFDSVRLRLDREQPLTFLEFNYMILQAYDFVELYKKYGCILQMGGSDQWGNIVSGIELGRRLLNAELFALTTPLLTTSSGAKMGKTETGAVWLNPEMMTPYDYWQFWRNCEDGDVGRLLRLFTELPLDEIARLTALKGHELNEAKKVLATEATRLLHGAEAAELAAETARRTFEEGALAETLPTVEISRARLEAGLGVLTANVEAGLVSSNGEARRQIKGGGLKVNDVTVADEKMVLTHRDLTPQGVIKLSLGKKRHVLLKPV